ncbi:MAG: hypothetical protein WCF29_04115, partial [Pseudolabrys sp.]
YLLRALLNRPRRRRNDHFGAQDAQCSFTCGSVRLTEDECLLRLHNDRGIKSTRHHEHGKRRVHDTDPLVIHACVVPVGHGGPCTGLLDTEAILPLGSSSRYSP